MKCNAIYRGNGLTLYLLLNRQAYVYFGDKVDLFASVFSEIGEVVVPYSNKSTNTK